MKLSATIESSYNKLHTTVETDTNEKQLLLPVKSNGLGSAVNGGELLLLALATCFCNDIYREAEKKGIVVTTVKVTAFGEFGAAGEAGTNFRYTAEIKADATSQEIDALIDHTDKVAEIHNSLRQGVGIKIMK